MANDGIDLEGRALLPAPPFSQSALPQPPLEALLGELGGGRAQNRQRDRSAQRASGLRPAAHSLIKNVLSHMEGVGFPSSGWHTQTRALYQGFPHQMMRLHSFFSDRENAAVNHAWNGTPDTDTAGSVAALNLIQYLGIRPDPP